MVSFVKTNEQVAKLLNIKLLKQRNRRRGQLSEINGWRARPDFPAYQKGKGYSAVEVLQWSERFASQIAPEKQRREAVSQILGGDKPTAKAVKILSNVQGPMSNVGEGSALRAAADREVGAPGNPGPVPSQAAMAVELQLRYQLPIKRQTIHNWINGVHLPKGAPRFPINDPGRAGWNNPAPCYEWYEKWIVVPMRNAHAGDAVQGNLFEQKKADAIMAEFEEQIDKSRKMKAEADAVERENSKKWILRTDALSTSIQAIGDVLRMVEAEYERNAAARRREKLQAIFAAVERWDKLSVEDGAGSVPAVAGSAAGLSTLNTKVSQLLAEFTAWDVEDERGRFDRIKAACAANAERGTGSAEKSTTDKTG